MNEHERRQKVFIVTQYSLPDHKRNMNAYQRVFYGADHADISLLIRRSAAVSQEIHSRVHVHNALVDGRILFLLYAILYAGIIRLKGWRIILTDPSGYAYVGLAAKYLFGYRWAMDLWDRPRWRGGQHEEGMRPPLGDRFLFRAMNHADLFILSVLPRAVKDIDPPADRCVQFTNAITMAIVAAAPPERPADDDTLHLGFARSTFDDTFGLDIVRQAAAILVARGVPFHIHVIGDLDKVGRELLGSSPAGVHFSVHGVIPESRADFFRRIHAGLCPYKAFEDVSYIFPIKVLEHLSQGNPVIATNLPGIAVMVKDGENGLLVKPDNATDLANAIERLQKDRGLWERLARNALTSIRRFDAGEKNRHIFATLNNRLS